MGKHAFLIIAHNQPVLLQTLLNMIDYEQNDIYIHIDAKSNFDQFSSLTVSKSSLTFTERIKISWGDLSQIKAELLLFESALKSKQNYEYYHLISGVDLPLKNAEDFHTFFDNHQGTEFIGFADYPASKKETDFRTQYIHVLQKFGKNRNPLLRYGSSLIKQSFLLLQKVWHFKRTFDFEFRMGTNWCSITNDLVIYILKNKDFILNTYKNTVCCDEVYKQTLVYNSRFLKKVYKCNNQFDQCLREIDWTRGNPYTFKMDDFEILTNSKNMFARKFSESDEEFIKKLESSIH